MAEHYNELTTSHLGHNKILKLLDWNYYFPGIRKYVETYVATYNVCTRAKALHHKPFGLLQPLLIPDKA